MHEDAIMTQTGAEFDVALVSIWAGILTARHRRTKVRRIRKGTIEQTNDELTSEAGVEHERFVGEHRRKDGLLIVGVDAPRQTHLIQRHLDDFESEINSL